MKTKLLFFTLLLLAFSRVSSQPYCLFDTIRKEAELNDPKFWFKEKAAVERINRFRENNRMVFSTKPTGNQPNSLNPDPSCRNTIYAVPVVFHVMSDPSMPQTNLHDSLILKQLAILNKAFANELDPGNPFGVNTRIQFVLAKKRPNGTSFYGINHISDNSPNYDRIGNAQRQHLSSLAYYDREKYLNIWVVADIQVAGISAPTKGYSNIDYVSGIDGIIMRYDWLGSFQQCGTCGFDPDARGLALAHEVGHYLGLRHNFEGGCTDGTNASTCKTEGDFCCDTRPTKPDFSCPVPVTNACPILPFYGTQKDNYENLMSYAKEYCVNNFTADQTSLMHSVLHGTRSALVNAENLNLLDVDGCLTASWFGVSNSFLCEPDSVTFTAISHAGARYRWRVYNDSLQVKDTTLNTAAFKWLVSRYGAYHVKLTIITATDSVSLERKDMITLKNCGPILSSAQGHWYFGTYGGIRFRTGGAVLDVSAYKANPVPTINSGEGVVTQSQSNGDLLFYGGADYTGDFHLYKPDAFGNHIEVFPANVPFGNSSASQGALVVPFVSDSNRLHLFTADAYEYGRPGVYHHKLSITNTKLVDSANKPIPTPSGSKINQSGTVTAAEMIAAAPNCDNSYWMFMVDWAEDDAYANDKHLLVYKVTDSAVTYVGKSNDTIPQYFGQIKVSPDGTKVAAPGIVFQFDKKTGALSTLRRLPWRINELEYYGCSFSPDSKLVYFTTSEKHPGDPYAFSYIYQYDLESSDSLLSRKRLPTESEFTFFASLQLGPDNRIYVAKESKDYLGVINFPDSALTRIKPNACGYIDIGVPLKNSNGDGGTSISGLPNMIDAKMPAQVILDFTMIDSACGHVKFYPISCGTNFLWNFGDGGTSTLMNPAHNYALPGTYTVTLTVNGVQKTRSIEIGMTKVVMAGDTLVTCDNDEPIIFSVANANPTYQYTWTNIGGIEWPAEDGGTSVNVRNSAGTLILRAVNPKNGCYSTDTASLNPALVTNNTIRIDSGDCFIGDRFYIFGSSPTPDFIADIVLFQWEYSADGVNWISIPGATSRHFSDTARDLYYYRRFAHNYACEGYSNVVRIPRFKFIKDLKDQTLCDFSGNEVKGFSVEMFNLNDEPIKIQVFHYRDVAATKQWGVIDTFNYPGVYNLGVTAGDSVKFNIILPCSTFYSRTAGVKYCEVVMGHPQNCLDNISIINSADSLPDGTNTFLVVKNNVPCYANAELPDSLWKWQFTSTGFWDTWQDIPASGNDTLFLTVNTCAKGWYRALFYGATGDFGGGSSCKWLPACDAGVKVGSTIAGNADLWAMDSPADIGAEPNTHSGDAVYNSPDLWSRVTTYNTLHENPDFARVTPNRIYTRVRNGGGDTSKTAELHMYWTLASTSEEWPRSWKYNLTENGFFNLNHMRMYPKGSEINFSPIIIPPLPPGKDTVIGYDYWPPNPANYYNVLKGYPFNKSVPTTLPICFLSRIVQCDAAGNYGMAYPEELNNFNNVKNNNNIVTRNTHVVDFNPGNLTSPKHPIFSENVYDEVGNLRLAINNVGSGFFTYGYITIDLDSAFFRKWKDGGMVGYGYTLLPDSSMKISSGATDFYIEGVDMKQKESAISNIQFHLNPGVTVMTAQQYPFTLSQLSNDGKDFEGGFNFVVNVPPSIPIIIGKQEQKEKPPVDGSQQEKDGLFAEAPVFVPGQSDLMQTNTVNAYPNPFSGKVNLYIGLVEDANVHVEVSNAIGAHVATIKPAHCSKGNYTHSFDGSSLPSGMYFFKVTIGEESTTLRLVLTK